VGGFGHQTPPAEKDKVKKTHISSIHKNICCLLAKKGYDKITNIKNTPPSAQVGLWEQMLL